MLLLSGTGATVRIHIPSSYPPESLVLFVMSTWHILLALLVSRVGVLRSNSLAATLPAAAPVATADSTMPSFSQGAVS